MPRLHVTMKALLGKGIGSVTPLTNVMMNYFTKPRPYLTAHYSHMQILRATTASVGFR